MAGACAQRMTGETTQQKHKTSWDKMDIGGVPSRPAPDTSVPEQPQRRAPTTWDNLSSGMFDAPASRPARKKRTWAGEEKIVPRAVAQPREQLELVPGCDDDAENTLWPRGDAQELLAWVKTAQATVGQKNSAKKIADYASKLEAVPHEVLSVYKVGTDCEPVSQIVQGATKH